MLKTRVRVTSCFLWVALTLLGFYSPNPVKAETYTATATARDFYFQSQEQSRLVIRTFAQQYGIDSMLWLYDDRGVLLVANDDYFGLDSYISFQMQPGVQYRLRAGVCCGDPNRWYGTSYIVDPNIEAQNVAPTTTTTTVPPTTTTTLPLPDNAVWGVANEGWDLELTAPDGFVFSEVLFASYGTPIGADGRWTMGICHAQNSESVVSDYLIGRNTATIPANNGVFGDPCGGTYKRLAVTALYAPAPTTSTTSTTTSTTTTTTTTEAPQVQSTTTLASTTTLPPLVVAPSSSSTSTVPVTTTVAPSTTLPPTTTTTTLPSTSTTIPVTTSSTTIPPIDESLTPQEAVAIVTSAEVLQELTSTEATEVFDSLEVDELSGAEADALVEAVQDAPEEVREAFEEEVNIFDNKFNSYVPLGSNINVGQRKVLVAATGVLFMAPTVSVSVTSSSTSGTQSDSRKRR